MHVTAPAFVTIPIDELQQIADEWLVAGEQKSHSARTTECRKDFVTKFFWFFHQAGYTEIGTREIRAFLRYLTVGHKEPGGRWGNAHMTRPLRPTTIQDYHRYCRTLFNWAYKQELITVRLMERIEPPVVHSEVKQPLSNEQVQRLLAAAHNTSCARRDTAILMLLFDTGIRASELTGLRVEDIDLKNRSLRVLGKGDKFRTAYIGLETTRALMTYLRKVKRSGDEPLFISENGPGKGRSMTRSGLLQLLKRLGKFAGVTVNVHQLRRTFATTILREGASLNSVQNMLGHTDLKMTMRYLALAESDIEAQHRKFSPGDRLKDSRQRR